MGMPGKKWFRVARRKLFRSAPRETLIVLHNNNTSRSCFSEATTTTTRLSEDIRISLSKEELAAIQIQACFRGHLARRAFRALRSLVKLQAAVRGVCVRRQARIALHCMHALARLQVTIRARQLLLQ
ncbi:protein IQ-DOMAIN 20 [Coffea arabica]|uniref:Protein IQ-DOMAIN 20 n=1 Tax=Coffea arabica TaxID=13443 RepID=A0A6P6TKN4_COFAR|nr:protein IQ-DOMAIN 1-like [Coffea arabica]